MFDAVRKKSRSAISVCGNAALGEKRSGKALRSTHKHSHAETFVMRTIEFIVTVVIALPSMPVLTVPASFNQTLTGEYGDSVMSANVKAAVLRKSSLIAAEIDVKILMGTYQVSGFARPLNQFYRAVDVAFDFTSVKQIENHMQVPQVQAAVRLS
jgi:hypothetical protein